MSATEKLRATMRRPWVWIAAIAVLAAAGFGAKRLWFDEPEKPQVVTATVERGDIEDTVLATGQIGASKLVSVGARVTGEVKKLYVALGDAVKAGQPIADIDAQTQQNNLRDAQAAVRNAEAQLRARQAALQQADLAAKRARGLAAIDAGSRADLEQAEATLKTATADVAAQQAQLAQAKVAEDTTRINLGYTKVTAPMDGIVVAVVTEQGQTVNANQSAPTIIKLARLDTMTVKAQISEADVPRVKPGMPVYFSLLGEPDARIEAKLRAIEPGPTTIATDGSGTSSATSTSSSTASAIYYNGIFDVPNADAKLRINMTAQTTIVLAHARDVLVIPSAALGRPDRGDRADRAGRGRRGDRAASAASEAAAAEPAASAASGARHGRRGGDGSGAGRRERRGAGDRYIVKVLEGDQVVERSVRIGLNNRVQAEVLEGLREGEKVITSEARAPGTPPSVGRRGGGPRLF